MELVPTGSNIKLPKHMHKIIPCQDQYMLVRCNDYSVRKYTLGEIPSLEAPSSQDMADEIVYSPIKYRETEGVKV